MEAVQAVATTGELENFVPVGVARENDAGLAYFGPSRGVWDLMEGFAGERCLVGRAVKAPDFLVFHWSPRSRPPRDSPSPIGDIATPP